MKIKDWFNRIRPAHKIMAIAAVVLMLTSCVVLVAGMMDNLNKEQKERQMKQKPMKKR